MKLASKNIKQQHLELKSLVLQNFATFTNQEVTFTGGMNAIVGETGSGKSLLMEALALVLGERADKKIIRSGHAFASIEAHFKTQGNATKNFLDELGFPADSDEVIIKRVIYQEGKSKNFLNLQQCSLQTLQDFTREYIDLVGQFENQKLLSSTYQLELLDEYMGEFDLLEKYEEGYKEYSALLRVKQETAEQEKNRLQQIDFLKFQTQEIAQLSPSIEDENKLLEIKQNLNNNEMNEKALEMFHMYYEGNEDQKGLRELFDLTQKLVLKNKQLFSALIGEKIATAFNQMQEVEHDISKLSTQKLSEEEVAFVIDRLDKYQKLKRKYGGDIEQLLSQFEKYKLELTKLENIELEHSELDKKIYKLEKELLQLATELRQKRIKAAQKLSQSLTKQIQELNMKGALVDIRLDQKQKLTSTGLDELVFMVQTNPGEGIHPLMNVASGGELSRILLCLRQLSSATGKISIFLFDEVDTGIGGETALLLGKHLSELSKKIQVLAITHLPQIAFNADSLIKVEKQLSKIDQQERTISKVTHFQNRQAVMKEAKGMTELRLM
jgi:DNA repair protein RecN (Recombination protein N)